MASPTFHVEFNCARLRGSFIGLHGLGPALAIGELRQTTDLSIGETQDMDELGVELGSASACLADVAAVEPQPAIVEHAEIAGLRLGAEVLRNPPPEIAAHFIRATVIPAEPEWQPFGRVPDKLRMQQFPQSLSIAVGQRFVQVACKDYRFRALPSRRDPSCGQGKFDAS